MKEEKFYEFIQEVKQEIRDEIKNTVNGKIDALSKKFDAHKTEMKPIFDFYNATNMTSRIILKVAEIIIAIGVIAGSVLGFIKYVK